MSDPDPTFNTREFARLDGLIIELRSALREACEIAASARKSRYLRTMTDRRITELLEISKKT